MRGASCRKQGTGKARLMFASFSSRSAAKNGKHLDMLSNFEKQNISATHIFTDNMEILPRMTVHFVHYDTPKAMNFVHRLCNNFDAIGCRFTNIID